MDEKNSNTFKNRKLDLAKKFKCHNVVIEVCTYIVISTLITRRWILSPGFLAHLAKGNVSFCHPVAAMFGNGSKQNVHSLERTLHRCFLPSFTSFGWGFSEEKIKMWKVNVWQTTDTKWWQKSSPLLKER
jgi:hypothetical protein